MATAPIAGEGEATKEEGEEEEEVRLLGAPRSLRPAAPLLLPLVAAPLLSPLPEESCGAKKTPWLWLLPDARSSSDAAWAFSTTTRARTL